MGNSCSKSKSSSTVKFETNAIVSKIKITTLMFKKQPTRIMLADMSLKPR